MTKEYNIVGRNRNERGQYLPLARIRASQGRSRISRNILSGLRVAIAAVGGLFILPALWILCLLIGVPRYKANAFVVLIVAVAYDQLSRNFKQ